MFGTVVGLFIPAVLQAGFVIIGVEPFWRGRCRRHRTHRGRLGGPVPSCRRLTWRSTRQPDSRPVPSQHRSIGQVKGIPVNRTTALTAAGLPLVALPLAACTSSKPTEPAQRRHRRQRRRRERCTQTAPCIVNGSASKGE